MTKQEARRWQQRLKELRTIRQADLKRVLANIKPEGMVTSPPDIKGPFVYRSHLHAHIHVLLNRGMTQVAIARLLEIPTSTINRAVKQLIAANPNKIIMVDGRRKAVRFQSPWEPTL